MIDYDLVLYGPQYAIKGTDAVLDIDGTEHALRVIDKTRATALAGDVTVHEQRPACVVRRAELAERGIALDTLNGAHITFHGETWEVDAYSHDSPDGPETGEVTLFLFAVEPVDIDLFTGMDFSQAGNSGYVPLI